MSTKNQTHCKNYLKMSKNVFIHTYIYLRAVKLLLWSTIVVTPSFPHFPEKEGKRGRARRSSSSRKGRKKKFRQLKKKKTRKKKNKCGGVMFMDFLELFSVK